MRDGGGPVLQMPWFGSISVAAQRSPWLWKEESMLTMQGSNAEGG